MWCVRLLISNYRVWDLLSTYSVWVGSSLVLVGDFSRCASGEFMFLSSCDGAFIRAVVGWLLFSSIVQGCFCLVSVCGWLLYLWHGAHLQLVWGVGC